MKERKTAWNGGNRNKESEQNVILFFTDALCFFAAYYLSGIIWLAGYKEFMMSTAMDRLGESMITVIVAVFITALFVNVPSNFVSRGKFEELKSVVQKGLIFGAIVAIYELIRRTDEIPRGVYVITVFGGILLMYGTRFLVKYYLISRGKSFRHANNVIVITMKSRAKKIAKELRESEEWTAKISGFIVTDEHQAGRNIGKYSVVADRDTMMDYIKRQIVDEIYIDVDSKMLDGLRSDILQFEDMGIKVHLKLDLLDGFKDFNAAMESFNGVPVVTFSNREFDAKDMMIKRLFDIIGGLVGFVIMCVAAVIVGPLIKLESPGPLFFKQKRVGKNGRYFEIYKFRSMYVDAEERKAALMEQNEMSGLMFKMEDDPRITKIGRFIRKTSIDELPQFINVLKGDMSLVGTRPPTVSEFQKYEGHHKRRLSVRPGITGIWQAYGRNTVTDFEDVVKMDLEYIDNWSLGLDVKILARTVITVFTEGGK
jgi:exopolysaccharide biosynthesis polyprenyl glycosylphosphotransferase